MARKILLADDSVTAQSMGRRILTDAGYEVVTVSNGSAALKKIVECRPDLIVLDVYMPGYGGLEVCQRLKEARETARIPVLLSVGKLEPFKPEEARRVRADAYIVKPFEASELLTALTKLEDKIVPQPETYKPGRFAKAVAAVEPSSAPERGQSDEGYGDAETGWKDRLIIPHPAPKAAEAETEAPLAPDTEFHNLARQEDLKPVEAKQGFERPLPVGLPTDISAEEIAAIAAAAAAISGRSEEPALQEQAQVAEAVAESTATASPEIETASVASVTEESRPAASADGTVSDAAAATFASAPEAQVETVPESAPEAAPTPPAVELPIAPEPIVNSEVAAANESLAASEAPAAPVAAELTSPPEPAVADATKPAAADDEVLAALASLAPVICDEAANAVERTEPDPVTVAAAIASAGLAAVGRESGGPRWMAEAIPVDEQESTFLLEQEMEKAYAAMAAAEAAQTMVAAQVVETSASALETTAASSTAPPVYAAPAAVSASAPAASLSEPAPVAEGVSEIPVSPAVAMASETAAIASEEEVAFAAAAGAGSGTVEATPAAHGEGSHTTTPDFDVSERQHESELATAWANWKPVHESNTESQTAAQIADAEAGFHTPTEEAASVEPKPEPEAATATTDEAGEISDIVDNMLAELKPKLMAEISKKLKKGKNNKK